jgi:hypothetical protein
VNGLASTPFNVAVGGTDFAQFTVDPTTYWNQTNAPITQQSAKGYIPETTWNDSCANPLFQFLQGGTTNAETNCNNPAFAGFLDSVGGSGGKSLAWLKPSWQTGTPADSARDLPDISLFSSDGFLGSFYLICVKRLTGGVCDLNSFAGFGGTSVASPAFAGIMALLNQKWGVQGNPNFVLYKLPAKQANAFHDVPSGSTIAMPCFRGSTNCATQNQSHQFGVLSGFSTGAAYDLATGLGSVDAANMVNNWNKVTFTATTTALTLNSGNPVNITHGAAVPVTVSVTPNSATGDVALLVSPGTPGDPGIDFNTLASGTKTWSTNLLPGGTYSMIAHYEGDATRGGSYSSPSASVTVNPESSSVLMPGVVTGTDSNGNPVYSTSVAYGSSYLLRADVLNSQGNFCTTETLGQIACPTGTVAFTDNGVTLDAGTYKLNSLGYTEDQAIQLPGGPHTLAGTYSGDNSYKASSISTGITITRAVTSINYVNASGAWLIVNQPFSIRAEVISGSLGVPEGGTFTFFADGVPVAGTVNYGFSGNCGNMFFVCLDASIDGAVFSTSGTHTIGVTYNGDSNYASSSSAPVNISVFYPTSATLSANPANPVAGGSTTLTALIDTPAKNLTPTGQVAFNFYGGGPLPGVVTLTPITDANGNSALQATLNFSPAASHTTIDAVYTGDSNYLQSGTGAFTITVAGTDFSFAPAAPTATVSRGQTIAVGLGIDGQLDYNATINFTPSSVTGLPPASSASFTPTSVTGTGGTTLFIATTGPNASLPTPTRDGLRWWLLGTSGVFAGVFLFGGQRHRRLSSILSVLACILLGASVGCGGGGSSGGGGGGGTPAGNYRISVTATDGTHTHTATFTLIVQ